MIQCILCLNAGMHTEHGTRMSDSESCAASKIGALAAHESISFAGSVPSHATPTIWYACHAAAEALQFYNAVFTHAAIAGASPELMHLTTLVLHCLWCHCRSASMLIGTSPRASASSCLSRCTSAAFLVASAWASSMAYASRQETSPWELTEINLNMMIIIIMMITNIQAAKRTRLGHALWAHCNAGFVMFQHRALQGQLHK